MKEKLQEIYDRNIMDVFILDKESIKKALNESYDLGVSELFDWLSKNDYLSDDQKVLVEEWKNKNTEK